MKIAIAGASGRMGQMLIKTVLADTAVQLVSALDVAGSPWLGQDAGAFAGRRTGVAITDDIEAGLLNADCLIDFTRPAGTLAHLKAARRHGVKLVIGTTGFDDSQYAELAAAAQVLPMVVAANMSVGINVTFKLLEIAARLLSTDYDIEIIEAHHRYKADAPSGTALEMGKLIAQTLGRDFAQAAVYDRAGIKHSSPAQMDSPSPEKANVSPDSGPVTGERGCDRSRLTIGFSSVRGGDMMGDHTVLFAGTGERIEITHRSASRAIYAQGALRAAHFLIGKTAGLYTMQDVLGLR